MGVRGGTVGVNELPQYIDTPKFACCAKRPSPHALKRYGHSSDEASAGPGEALRWPRSVLAGDADGLALLATEVPHARPREALGARVDPNAKKQAEEAARSDTFEAIARERLGLQEQKLSAATFKKATWTFETLIFPRLGNLPISAIKAPDLLATLRKIEVRGKYETTHRAKQLRADFPLCDCDGES